VSDDLEYRIKLLEACLKQSRQLAVMAETLKALSDKLGRVDIRQDKTVDELNDVKACIVEGFGNMESIIESISREDINNMIQLAKDIRANSSSIAEESRLVRDESRDTKDEIGSLKGTLLWSSLLVSLAVIADILFRIFG